MTQRPRRLGLRQRTAAGVFLLRYWRWRAVTSLALALAGCREDTVCDKAPLCSDMGACSCIGPARIGLERDRDNASSGTVVCRCPFLADGGAR